MEPQYFLEQLVRDRIRDARADAQRAAAIRKYAQRRFTHALGERLIRLGTWLTQADSPTSHRHQKHLLEGTNP